MPNEFRTFFVGSWFMACSLIVPTTDNIRSGFALLWQDKYAHKSEKDEEDSICVGHSIPVRNITEDHGHDSIVRV